MFVHKKRFGQNFLHNNLIADKIVNYLDLSNRNVVEIGIGKGALTTRLVEVAKFVTGFEIDHTLFSYIEENFSKYHNFTPIFQDFLEADINLPQDTVIVSNPPYNISSPILFKFLNSSFYTEAILMFQEELADRILAKPNTKSYGKLTVIIDTFCTKEKIVKVDRKYFNPIPEVDSLVFYLQKKTKPAIEIGDTKNYFNFLSNCFLMKRKKLINNLTKNLKLNKLDLQALNFNLDRRPEELSATEYILLFQKLYGKKISC